MAYVVPQKKISLIYCLPACLPACLLAGVVWCGAIAAALALKLHA